LVVAVEVNHELPRDLSGCGVDDGDVEFLDEQCDVGSGVGSSDAEVESLVICSCSVVVDAFWS
jgi:hypothetical protein